MRISFVIPTHNEEHYIGKCLDSIFTVIGDDPDVEVIITDNNSTDRTCDVIRSFPRAKLIHEAKPGANSARHAGYLAASGELIANVDADTMIDVRWFERATNTFTRNPRLVCLSGPFVYYDLPRSTRFGVKFFYFFAYLSHLINHFVLRRASVIQGGNYVVKKSALREIGGYNTDLTFYGDDADLARRLNKIGRVKFTFDFPIRSSGRRLAAEGKFTMGLRYGLNYFWIVLFGRPFTTTAVAVRPKQVNGKLEYEMVNTAREWASAAVIISALLAALILAVGSAALFIYGLIRLI